MKAIKNALTPYRTFILFCAFGIISFFIFALIRGAYAFDWISIGNQGGLHFIDYFNHVVLATMPDKIYENAPATWGNFPPFAYLLYRFLYLITAPSGTTPTDTIEMMNSYYTMGVFLIYSILVIVLLIYAIGLWCKENKSLGITICLLFSVPFFAGGVERGNAIVLVLGLLLIAVKWKDSGSGIKREVALILIAVSSGFKIYPAVFGLLYLKEHRFKETLRLIIYGIVIVFSPFLMFGRKRALIYWIAQIIATSKVTVNLGRMEYIKGIVYTVTSTLAGSPSELLCTIIPVFFLIVLLLLVFVGASKHRTVFYLCCAMALYPINSHRYTLCYFCIPLCMLLCEFGDNTKPPKRVWIETVLYGLLFCIPTLMGAITGFKLKFSDISYYTTYVELWIYAVTYILLIYSITAEVIDIVKHKKWNRNLLILKNEK